MGRVVLLYSDPTDPLVAAICSQPEIVSMHVDTLLPFLRPEAWPIVATLDAPKAIVDMFSGQFVINRLFSLAGTQLQGVLRSLGVHEQWGHFLLSGLLDLSAGLVHDEGPRGVSRSLMPLTTQWHMLKDHTAIIAVPRYEFAFGGAVPNLDGLQDPMQKSVWSLYDWRTERHLPAAEANWHRFFVERPVGAPVLCWYVGVDTMGQGGVRFSFPREIAAFTEEDACQLAILMAKTFKSSIGEFVVYVEPAGIKRFCAFSPVMKTAQSHPDFAPLLHDWSTSLEGAARRSARKPREVV